MKTGKGEKKIVPKIEKVVKNRTKRESACKKYCKWSEKKMVEALEAMRTRSLGLNKAAKIYSIPKATLKRYLEGKNRFAAEGKKFMGRPKSIPLDIENEIKERVQLLEDTPFGITGIELRKLVYDIAESRGIPHKFSRMKKTAGKNWYYNFIRRHPELNLRRPNESYECILAVAFEQQLREGDTPIDLQGFENDENSEESQNETDSESDEEEFAKKMDEKLLVS